MLNAALGKAEMRNWDEVSLHGMVRTLAELTDAVDYVVIGNNAGQGLPLAQAVPQALRATPRESFRQQLARTERLRTVGLSEFLSPLRDFAALARGGGSDRAGRWRLYFMNSIQHNTMNYHDP